METDKKLLGTGIVTAIAASLCCITPVLALIAGTSGIASTFSWLDPFRPYLIGLTVLVLGFAWYQKLKPKSKEELECECEENKKTPFTKSKSFLTIVTLFAAVMLAFPNYAHIFYPEQQKEKMVVSSENFYKVEFSISGMTCEGCENHIEHEVNKLNGIIKAESSYDKGNTVVEFDNSLIKVEEIEAAILKTDYKITNTKTN